MTKEGFLIYKAKLYILSSMELEKLIMVEIHEKPYS